MYVGQDMADSIKIDCVHARRCGCGSLQVVDFGFSCPIVKLTLKLLKTLLLLQDTFPQAQVNAKYQ